MTNKSDTQRLSDAMTALGATILEIVNEKMKLALEARGTVQPVQAAPVPTPPIQPVLAGWVGKKELAKHLNVRVRTVDNLTKRRAIPFVKLGRKRIIFKLSEVDETLNRSYKLHARL